MDETAIFAKPLDSATLQLTDEIIKITELLAENTHKAWQRERIHQGWRYGPIRDDVKKTHPSLVDYLELSELDKQVNRKAALEAVKALLSVTHVHDNAQIQSLIAPPAEIANKNLALITQFKKQTLTVAQLRRLWNERVPAVWLRDVEVYRRAVDAALRLGEAFLAFDMTVEGLSTFRGDLRLIQLQALALARTGATRQANQLLEQLRLSGHQDEETLGLLARTYKDFWLIATDPIEKLQHLDTSFRFYEESYRRNRGYYSGINAAATGLIAGKRERAHQIAVEVTSMCVSALSQSPDSGERYWLLSTLAEAALILGDLEAAATYYRSACDSGRQGWAVVNRTRSQARILLEHSGHSPEYLDFCFPSPRIVVFSGHMFDRPTRPQPRFPVSLQARVRREIDRRLEDVGAQVGFCSLACGSDMIFAEAMLARGGEINVVLPFEKAEFEKASVNFIPGMNFLPQFERILENAATVTTLTDSSVADDGAVYEYCNKALAGLALLKGRFLGVEVLPMVVWNGKAGDGRGGTEGFLNDWPKHQSNPEIIRLDKILEQETGISASAAQSEPATPAAPAIRLPEKPLKQEIRAMLFADIVGFTKLSESQIPPFAFHLLGRVAAVMESLKHPPIARNTWGDAIYCVFDNVASAGTFAMKLRMLMEETNWEEMGLRKDLKIRIALHAGPAYAIYDPIVGRTTFLGSHVNRTARIEPIAEEGQIYASQAFAALAAAEGVKELVCDYVGEKQLAKGYGAFPVFLVRLAKGMESTMFYRKSTRIFGVAGSSS